MSNNEFWISRSTTYDKRYDVGPFATREEAVDEAQYYADTEGTSCWIARSFEWKPNVSGDSVIEQASGDAYELVGECSSDWLEFVAKEDERELSEVLTKTFQDWIAKHGYGPHFFGLKDEEEIKPAAVKGCVDQ